MVSSESIWREVKVKVAVKFTVAWRPLFTGRGESRTTKFPGGTLWRFANLAIDFHLRTSRRNLPCDALRLSARNLLLLSLVVLHHSL